MTKNRPILLQPYISAERQKNNQLLWENYSRDRDTIGINIGSGTALKAAFLNCDLEPQYNDVFALDVTFPFPWDSNSFDYVFSEHMIEHISYERGNYMLKECFRILKPGGVIRIVTPSIEFLCRMFQGYLSPIEKEYVDWAQRQMTPNAPASLPSFVFNTFVRSWGHTFIYDRPTLKLTMQDAGFCQVNEQKISISGFEFLNGLEAVHRMPPGFLELESMIFEGCKE